MTFRFSGVTGIGLSGFLPAVIFPVYAGVDFPKTLSTLEKTVGTLEISILTLEKTVSTFVFSCHCWQ